MTEEEFYMRVGELRTAQEQMQPSPAQARAIHAAEKIRLLFTGHFVCSAPNCPQCVIREKRSANIILSTYQDLEQENERLRKAIEAQPHGRNCHLNSDRPFSDKARESWDAKGCDCWKQKALAS